MDRPGGGGRDEAEGSEARARVGVTGGAGEIEGAVGQGGLDRPSIVLLRRGRWAVASNDPQLAPALGSFETAPG